MVSMGYECQYGDSGAQWKGWGEGQEEAWSTKKEDHGAGTCLCLLPSGSFSCPRTGPFCVGNIRVSFSHAVVFISQLCPDFQRIYLYFP